MYNEYIYGLTLQIYPNLEIYPESTQVQLIAAVILAESLCSVHLGDREGANPAPFTPTITSTYSNTATYNQNTGIQPDLSQGISEPNRQALWAVCKLGYPNSLYAPIHRWVEWGDGQDYWIYTQADKDRIGDCPVLNGEWLLLTGHLKT